LGWIPVPSFAGHKANKLLSFLLNKKEIVILYRITVNIKANKPMYITDTHRKASINSKGKSREKQEYK
jgi:hypothetical protein